MNKENIHRSSIIEEGAILGMNINIGPFCFIGKNVKIGDNCIIHSHVVIDGFTEIGNNNEIYPFATLGKAPQDLKFSGEESKLVIGNNNKIREYCTFHPGTKHDNMLTKIGNNCLFMIGAHIAHDCIIGNNVIMANNATLAGHVKVGDNTIIGGLSAVHQFVRIGNNVIIGGMSGIDNDVIPYGQAKGERASLSGLNLIGLKRSGFSKDEINNLRKSYNLLFYDRGTLDDRVKLLSEKYKNDSKVMDIVNFIQSDKSRPLCQPKNLNINLKNE